MNSVRQGGKSTTEPRRAGKDAAGGRSETPRPNREEVTLECGWGQLIMAQTFSNPADVALAVQAERHGARNIAMYVQDPHVILAQAPQQLFLDPSHTYRLALKNFIPPKPDLAGYTLRRMRSLYAAQDSPGSRLKQSGEGTLMVSMSSGP